ncbi:unnamed protein product [Rangifer tarandus platyrhynchus]|uniref:Uncharacterized protein n=1 Tax=Rangifer tarandus platyrhynchus TaxID=3082113 RepID=A0AC60A7R3_RANTA
MHGSGALLSPSARRSLRTPEPCPHPAVSSAPLGVLRLQWAQCDLCLQATVAGLLPTPNPSVLPLPFQLILRVCPPRSPPPLGWSPILPPKVRHRDPHGVVRGEKTACGSQDPHAAAPGSGCRCGAACMHAHSHVSLHICATW